MKVKMHLQLWYERIYQNSMSDLRLAIKKNPMVVSISICKSQMYSNIATTRKEMIGVTKAIRILRYQRILILIQGPMLMVWLGEVVKKINLFSSYTLKLKVTVITTVHLSPSYRCLQKS